MLSAFLIFAGLGSLLANRLVIKQQAKAWMRFAVLGIGLIASIDLLLLDILFDLFAGHALWSKLGMAVILVAQLALFERLTPHMGIAVK